MYFIGIDIGTTNTKVCLYRDQDFSCLQKYIFSTPKITTDRYIDFDVKILWDNIKIKLKAIISQYKNIGNICIASVGESGVLVDDKGNVIGPAITWYDTRTIEQAEYVINKIGLEKLYEITGIPAHSNYSINKILWIFKNCNIESKQKLKWLSMASFIAYKLSGVSAIDYSLASRTMAFDIKNKSWSKEILDELDMEISLMPDLVESGEPIGSLNEEIAKEFGTNDNITVSIGGHDHMCGAVATGLFSSSEMLDSTGTTEGLLVIRNKPGLKQSFLDRSLSNGVYTLADFYTLFASLPAGGLSFEWMKNIFFSKKTNFDQIFNSIELMNSGDIVYIPHLRGSGPPKRCTTTQGIIYGLKDTSSNLQIARAILEGVCFELKVLYDEMIQDFENKFSSIKVIGSAVKNPVWLQLKADILNCRIEANNVDEAVAKGAALLAAYKYDKIKLSDIKEMNKNQTVSFEPRPELSNYYNEKFNKTYKPIYDVSINMGRK